MPARKTAKPAPSSTAVDLAHARAFWQRRQGLATPSEGRADAIVDATGWPRTLGGADVYLALRARKPGMRRRELDEAVEASHLQVVPAVRGCIYLVPRGDVPLVLRTAEEIWRKRTDRDLEKVKEKWKTVEALAETVATALREGPAATDAIRKRLPEGAVRSYGEPGKKIGLSSNLPIALRVLEFSGRVERTLEEGRLDTERYQWRLTKKSPLTGAKVPADRAERYGLLASIFFRQLGPARAEDFSCWSVLSQRDTKDAIERAGLVPVTVAGWDDPGWIHPGDLPALRDARPAEDAVALLPFEDGYVVSHGGPGWLADEAHRGLEIPVWGRGAKDETTIATAKHISMRPLIAGGRLVGFWEYDPDTARIVTGTFAPLSAKAKRATGTLAEETAAFLRDDIGHAHSFSLDTDDELRKRVRQVNEIGGKR
jgi:hypothetical protein